MTTRSVKGKAAIGVRPPGAGHLPRPHRSGDLRFFALYGMTGPDMKRRVEEVLEIIGLRDRAGDRAKEYSGGDEATPQHPGSGCFIAPAC